jgi:hypothetical protein
VAAALAVTRPRITQIVARARERWRKLRSVDRLRDELIVHLHGLAGVATAVELERAVLADRGSDLDQDAGLARAAVRAAVEVELAQDESRIAQRRSAGGRVLLASAGTSAAERQRVLDHAAALGALADEIAALETLAAPAEVAARLRRLPAPDAFSHLSPDRLVELAAAASATAAASARLELHPRDMSAERALALGRAALLGSAKIGVGEVRRRIAARFPDARALPDRPELDVLLRESGFELRWSVEDDAYIGPSAAPASDLTSYASSISRLPTASEVPVARRAGDPLVIAAEAFERRLVDAQRDAGMLTLMAYPPDLAAAGGMSCGGSA